MRSRPSFIFLFSALFLVAPPGVERAMRLPARLMPGRASIAYSPTSLARPRSSTVFRARPAVAWRYRLKSVLEETDVRGFAPIDLGPAAMPVGIVAPNRPGWAASRPRSRIPLRC